MALTVRPVRVGFQGNPAAPPEYPAFMRRFRSWWCAAALLLLNMAPLDAQGTSEQAQLRTLLKSIAGGEHVVLGNVTIKGDDAWVDSLQDSEVGPKGSHVVAYLHRFPFGWRAIASAHRYRWQLQPASGKDFYDCDFGPAEDVTAVRKLYDPHSFGGSVHVVGDWADGSEEGWNSGGEIIYHRVKGKWTLLSSARGGAFDQANLTQFGMPAEIIAVLRPPEASASASPAASQSASPQPGASAPTANSATRTTRTGNTATKTSAAYLLPAVTSRPLIDRDLSGRDGRALTLARNEIFARHGRIFHDPELRKYFHAQPWYHESSSYSDASLSEVERRNAQFILDYQNQHHLNW
jgi:hypothetical protein